MVWVVVALALVAGIVLFVIVKSQGEDTPLMAAGRRGPQSVIPQGARGTDGAKQQVGVLLERMDKGEIEPVQGYDEIVAILKREVQGGRRELERDLGAFHLDRAGALANIRGDLKAAAESYGRGIEIYKKLGATLAEHHVDLAQALVLRAGVFLALGELESALAHDTEGVSILEKLAGNTPSEFDGRLAMTLRARAEVLASKGDAPASLADSKRGIDLLERQVASGNAEAERELAITIRQRSEVQASTADVAAARAGFDRYVSIFERLARRGDKAERYDHAKSLRGRADFLAAQGDFASARKDMDAAARLMDALQSDGAQGIEPEVALAWAGVSGVALAQSDYPAALEARDKALATLKKAIAAGAQGLDLLLAEQLGEKSSLLDETGDAKGSIDHASESIGIYERLSKAGEENLEVDFATALMGRGVAELDLSRDVTAALRDQDRAVSMIERLMKKNEAPELQVILANLLSTRGYARWRARDPEAALADADRVMGIVEAHPDLWPDEGERESLLAGVHRCRAFAALALGDASGREAFEKGLEIFRKEKDEEDGGAMKAELSSHLGAFLAAQGDLEGARAACDRARKVHEKIVATGRLSIESDLADTLTNQASIRRLSKDLDGALESADKACAIFERFVARGGHFQGELARATTERARALAAAGDASAKATFDRVVELFGAAKTRPHLLPDVFDAVCVQLEEHPGGAPAQLSALTQALAVTEKALASRPPITGLARLRFQKLATTARAKGLAGPTLDALAKRLSA